MPANDYRMLGPIEPISFQMESSPSFQYFYEKMIRELNVPAAVYEPPATRPEHRIRIEDLLSLNFNPLGDVIIWDSLGDLEEPNSIEDVDWQKEGF